MQASSSRELTSKPLVATNVSAPKPWASALCSGWGLIGMAVAAYWISFFNEVRGEWQVNPQYNYGFLVPLLAAILLWRRWPGRPIPEPGNGRVAMAIICFLLLTTFPLRVLFEANPEWRLLYWLSGSIALGITLCALAWCGGASWAGYFAPPLLFIFVALPWPVELEQAAIQGLMRLVAGLTVGVVTLLGKPAIQHGNLIEVGAGLVGIDEACSGVRSLQSSLMLSLFLGELNRWSWMRRCALIGASILLVLLANLTRTTFLVWIAATRGLQQMQAWHDRAGILIMLIALGGLFGLSYLMKPRQQNAESTTPHRFPLPSIPRWAGVTMICWLALSEGATELWYRAHEKNLIRNVDWSVAWPTTATHFQKTDLPENSRIILRCDQSESASWQDDAGNDWSAFVLNWEPGRNSAQLAKGHRPDICFPAAGAKRVNDFGRVWVPADGFDLPFVYETFENGDKLLHVFYCLWSDKIAPGDDLAQADESRAGRIRAALAGKRNLGQKVVEIVISGPESREAAVNLLRAQVATLIRKS